MAHEVFISYASRDKTVAEAVCNRLESQRIRCWIAPRNITPGQNYPAAINNAIENSQAVVLLFSSAANASKDVQNEVALAFDHHKTVVPYRLENVKPTGAFQYHLGTVQWLDAWTPPRERHLQKLVDVILPMLRGVARAPLPIENTPTNKSPFPWAAFLGGVFFLGLVSLLLIAKSFYGPQPQTPVNTPAANAAAAPSAATTGFTNQIKDWEVHTSSNAFSFSNAESETCIGNADRFTAYTAPGSFKKSYAFEPPSSLYLFDSLKRCFQRADETWRYSSSAKVVQVKREPFASESDFNWQTLIALDDKYRDWQEHAAEDAPDPSAPRNCETYDAGWKQYQRYMFDAPNTLYRNNLLSCWVRDLGRWRYSPSADVIQVQSTLGPKTWQTLQKGKPPGVPFKMIDPTYKLFKK
jgi:TIR domain